MASSTSHGALAYFAVHALQEWWRLREGEKRPKRCKEKEHMHTPTKSERDGSTVVHVFHLIGQTVCEKYLDSKRNCLSL
uniref:Uncharacterized protein n=1 Tax=Megaselia scalaris TaxID=36166 RepID=T1GUU4_MEGSC